MSTPSLGEECESWTINKAECWRINAFQLWCWRRLLSVPWIARSNCQSQRKSALNIHWKYWCWSWSSNTWPPDAKSQLFGKEPDAGKDWEQKEEKVIEDEMVDGITDSKNISLSKPREIVNNREAWHAAVHGVTKSQTLLSDWTATLKIMKVTHSLQSVLKHVKKSQCSSSVLLVPSPSPYSPSPCRTLRYRMWTPWTIFLYTVSMIFKPIPNIYAHI